MQPGMADICFYFKTVDNSHNGILAAPVDDTTACGDEEFERTSRSIEKIPISQVNLKIFDFQPSK